MTGLRHPWRWFLFGMMACGLSALAGCGGCTGAPPPHGSNHSAQDQGKSLKVALEFFASSTEAGGFRAGLEQVNNHLTNHPDALAKYQPAKADRPALLHLLGNTKADQQDEAALWARLMRERFALEDDEIKDVRDGTFRPLDAHHLALAFFLRDAAVSMQLPKLPPLSQARRCLDWVCRQIVLQERPDGALAPPAWALRRGHGTAHDRSLVFAAMLQQLNLDVAMVALPESGGKVRYWLPGVLVEDKGQSDLYLFDTRLGMPVPGPKGGIATLAQLRAQPELLKPLGLDDTFSYGVSDKQLESAEIHLICPLSALAPRMRFLEAELAVHNKVRLALDPVKLLQRFEAAKQGPVKVWNQRRTGNQVQPGWVFNPTRVLRVSLPPAEGGIGVPENYTNFQHALVQWAPARQTVLQLDLREKLGPRSYGYLMDLLGDVVKRFVLEPRVALQRGRDVDAQKRLEKLRIVLGEFESAQQQEGEFQSKLKEWRARIREAAIRFETSDKGAAAQNQWLAAWGEDQYLYLLLTANEDVQVKEAVHKTVLSFLIYRAEGESLRNELARLEALRWHELADRLQGKLDRFVAADHPDGAALRQGLARETKEAWDNAQELWGKYAARVSLTPAAFAARLQPLHEALRTGPPDLAVDVALHLQRELRQSAAAGLLQAYCLEKLDNKQAAAATLERLAGQITELRKHPELQTLVDRFEAKGFKQVRTSLFTDFEPNGTLHWLVYSAKLSAQTAKR